MQKEKLFFILSFVFPALLTYFLAIQKYEYSSTVDSKQLDESEYMLRRRKESDLVLTYDEFRSFKIDNPDNVYISDKKYYLIIENENVEVDSIIYSKYNQGDPIKYKKSILINTKKIIIP
jgi:hypothetical protein